MIGEGREEEGGDVKVVRRGKKMDEFSREAVSLAHVITDIPTNKSSIKKSQEREIHHN